MVAKNKATIIKKLTKELIDQLELPVTFELKQDQDLVNLNLATENPGILIGYHGETLAALQLILSMMAYRKIGEWTRIVADVGDYRQKRAESLEKMAQSAAQKVKFSKTEHALPPMNSAERRVIHLALAGDSEVETVSEGEGKDRRIVIKPKKVDE